jgi:outer membrane protein
MRADQTQSRRASKAGAVRLAVFMLSAASGCDIWRRPPDVREAWQPERLAPPAVNRSWHPPEPPSAYRAPADAWQHEAPSLPSAQETYDLPALVDLALRDNPDTRSAWEAARSAAARYGRSLAPYYPTLRAQGEAAPASRFFEPTASGSLTIHRESYEPRVLLTYTLLDFGRRAQSAELARQRLLAANFAFNRRLQDVVFGVERAYYLLDAAQGLERAAERNLELARTVLRAAEQRVDVGLATRPELLLARQVETRAVYELENARVAVKNAEAELALTLGVPANRSVAIESLEKQPLPPELDQAVDGLIDTALMQRPDLAARVADLRAADAAVAKAKADFFPTIDFRGHYGESIWDYRARASGPFRNSEPTYATVFTFNWDIFKGFDRLNAVREAEADSRAARAELAATELEAIADVWRAYYDYRAAVRKLQFAEALLAASQEAYDSTLKTYEVGLSDIVELLTAERDLAAARYTLIQSRAELLTTAARVAYAAGAMPVGSLTKPSEPVPAPVPVPVPEEN